MTAFLSLPPVSMPWFPGTARIYYFKNENRAKLSSLFEQIMGRILHRLTLHIRLTIQHSIEHIIQILDPAT